MILFVYDDLLSRLPDALKELAPSKSPDALGAIGALSLLNIAQYHVEHAQNMEFLPES